MNLVTRVFALGLVCSSLFACAAPVVDSTEEEAASGDPAAATPEEPTAAAKEAMLRQPRYCGWCPAWATSPDDCVFYLCP